MSASDHITPLGPEFAEMTWPEVQEAVEQNYVALWAIGATEQHGPHLPLNVDAVISHQILKAVAGEVKALLIPPLPFGCRSKPQSGGGQSFPGTVSIAGETMIKIVSDVVAEIARQGFNGLAILNGHAENTNFIYEGVSLVEEAGDLAELKVMSVDAPDQGIPESELSWMFEGGGAFQGWDAEHAAVSETSTMLYLRPDLVRKDLIANDRVPERSWYDVVPTPERHIAKTGVLADASNSSVDKGRRYIELVVPRLVQALMREFDVERQEDVDRGSGPSIQTAS